MLLWKYLKLWDKKTVSAPIMIHDCPNPASLLAFDSFPAQWGAHCSCLFWCLANLILLLLLQRNVTLKYHFASIWQTNGNKQSEFLVDLISTKWSSSFHNVEAVLDFAGIKRFVTGYRRWTPKHGCRCNTLETNNFSIKTLVRIIPFVAWVHCGSFIHHLHSVLVFNCYVFSLVFLTQFHNLITYTIVIYQQFSTIVQLL